MGAAVSARTVSGMLAQLERCRSVRKSDLRHGDCVLVTTENSVYSICVLEDMTYAIRGGWFDRNGLSPVKTSISGCTWGGSAIKRDIVAACGLHLEFGNRVITSRIREVGVIRANTGQVLGWQPAAARDLSAACYGSRGAAAIAG